MATPASAIDFSDLGGQKVIAASPASTGGIDFSDLGGQRIQDAPINTDPLTGASQATGISADTRGPFRRAWDEIKSGLTAAQPGGGLTPQPTTLGNAAEFLGMAGDTAANLLASEGAAEGAADIANRIPNATRAAQNFQELKGAIGNHTVQMTDHLANTLADIKDAVDTGSTLPPVINKFVTRIADVGEKGGALTYNEARQFYHNISELSASEKMAAKPSDLRLIQNFKHALGDTIATAADSAGRLQQYQGAMSEFSRAKGLQEGLKTAGKAALAATGLGGAISGGWNAYETLKKLAAK